MFAVTITVIMNTIAIIKQPIISFITGNYNYIFEQEKKTKFLKADIRVLHTKGS